MFCFVFLSAKKKKIGLSMGHSVSTEKVEEREKSATTYHSKTRDGNDILSTAKASLSSKLGIFAASARGQEQARVERVVSEKASSKENGAKKWQDRFEALVGIVAVLLIVVLLLLFPRRKDAIIEPI